MLFICYPKCSTCKKAQAYLDSKKIKYDYRDIKLDNPTVAELTEWIARSGLDTRKFFNTSGMQYRALELKDKLPNMTGEEMINLLATDGMLVKRPLLITEDKVLVGFKQSDYDKIS
ncbi:MAG: arsenate reductase family protein [Saccharofermentans sp.]|nr:arsenate reductase family protein [Saccharofermentans sp.]